METEKAYVGIDVSKETLDMAVHASEQRWRFGNTDNGITEALTALRSCLPRWWSWKLLEA